MSVGAIFKYLHGARCVHCNEHIEQDSVTGVWAHYNMSSYCKDGKTIAETKKEKE